MANTWTSPADKATNDVITATIWNQLLGATGNLQYLYDGGGGTRKYKTSTQVFTTNTTFADITASSGSFAFAIAASEVWEVDYFLPLSFGGTGGVKLQLTGPAAPTSVAINGTNVIWRTASTTDSKAFNHVLPITTVTAFSSSIAAADSVAAAVGDDGVYANNGGSVFVHIHACIVNGANAGTVTLQGAQNSSNSTTTFGLGCYMKAQRLA